MRIKNMLPNVSATEWIGFVATVAIGSLMLAYGVAGIAKRLFV